MILGDNKMIKKIFKNSHFRCFDDCNITFDEINKKLQNGAILIDVRSLQEYNEGHLHNAIHLADYDILKKCEKLLPNKEREIILYCQNGGRSKKAYKKLKKLGFTNVYNLCGGLDSITY